MEIPKALIQGLKNEPTTSFVLGTCLQALLIICLPLRLALLPTAFLLATKLFTTLSPKSQTPPSTPSQNPVLQGRWTAQLPRGDGSDPIGGSDAEVVAFVLGASSNQ